MIEWEWTVEYLENWTEGEVKGLDFDFDHPGTYAECVRLAKGEYASIVLVRHRWKDDSLASRTWAYVKDGMLPSFATDHDGEEYKVPIRYHREVMRCTGLYSLDVHTCF